MVGVSPPVKNDAASRFLLAAFTLLAWFVTFDGAYADWEDETQPRTERPVRFVPRVVAPFGLRWGLVNRFALVSPSRIA